MGEQRSAVSSVNLARTTGLLGGWGLPAGVVGEGCAVVGPVGGSVGGFGDSDGF